MDNTKENNSEQPQVLKLLLRFGFEETEAKIYASLLKPEVETALDIARDTRLNRTTVYRKIDEMMRRGVVSEVTNVHGTHLEVVPPKSLGKLLTEQETEIERRREALTELSKLAADATAHDTNFAVHTFSGQHGVEQMLWNELSAEGGICVFGYLLLQDVVGQRFAEKWRNEAVQRKIPVRELQFEKEEIPADFTEIKQYHKQFEERALPDAGIFLRHQISIYNNVVAIYNWKSDHFTGVEIRSADYANFQRSLFERYWEEAKPVTYPHSAKKVK